MCNVLNVFTHQFFDCSVKKLRMRFANVDLRLLRLLSHEPLEEFVFGRLHL